VCRVRLQGNYDNIGIGGQTTNALVDFTGGISESIDLRKIRSSPGDLFDVMYAMMQKSSMMACDIQVTDCFTSSSSPPPSLSWLYVGRRNTQFTNFQQCQRILKMK